MIISHTILILQLHYSREATANRAPGQPLVFTAPGRFESAPVGYFNVEVAAAAGRGRGDDDNDDDDDDDDDDNDDDDDDDDDNDDGNQKPSGGGIILVPRAERQRDHRGMASVTTMIGNIRSNTMSHITLKMCQFVLIVHLRDYHNNVLVLLWCSSTYLYYISKFMSD